MRAALAVVAGSCFLVGACGERAPGPQEPEAERRARFPACPPGAERRGALPPRGREAWCERDGQRHGPYVHFYDDGQVERRGAYARGRRIGRWRRFYRSGRLAERGVYRDGARDGLWVRFHRNGELFRRGGYRDGEMHGHWEWFRPSGQRAHLVSYERGLPQVARTFDSRRREIEITTFEDGRPVETLRRDDEGVHVENLQKVKACQRLAARRPAPASGRGPAAELALLVLVDGTGGTVQPLSQVQELLQALSRSLRADDLVGVSLFGEEVIEGLPLAPLAQRNLSSSVSGFSNPGVSADTCRALHEARRQLAGVRARSRHILLLAYGTPSTHARSMARAIRKAGQRLHIVDLSALRWPQITPAGGADLAAMAEAAGGEVFSEIDPRRLARALLTRAFCSESDPVACVRLGLRHLRGDGVKKSRSAGLRLLRLGCERDEPWGCARLGEARLASGETEEAARAFRAGCERGSGYACWQLGRLHQSGRGAPRDPARARGLFRRGCTFGSASACAEREARGAR